MPRKVLQMPARDVWDASSYCKQWEEEMRWGLKDGVQGAFMFRATIGRGEASRTLVGRASGRRLAVTNKEAHQVQARAVSNQMDRSRWQEAFLATPVSNQNAFLNLLAWSRRCRGEGLVLRRRHSASARLGGADGVTRYRLSH